MNSLRFLNFCLLASCVFLLCLRECQSQVRFVNQSVRDIFWRNSWKSSTRFIMHKSIVCQWCNIWSDAEKIFRNSLEKQTCRATNRQSALISILTLDLWSCWFKFSHFFPLHSWHLRHNGENDRSHHRTARIFSRNRRAAASITTYRLPTATQK